MKTDKLKIYRNMLKSSDIDELKSIRLDCQKGVSEPEALKPYNLEDELIKLCEMEDFDFEFLNFFEIIKNRKSRRNFSGEKMTFKKLSFLLWSSCGVREIKNDRIFRTASSACCRHPFETYGRAYCRLEGKRYAHAGAAQDDRGVWWISCLKRKDLSSPAAGRSDS